MILETRIFSRTFANNLYFSNGFDIVALDCKTIVILLEFGHFIVQISVQSKIMYPKTVFDTG